MILDSTLSLEAVLASSVASNEPFVHVYYRDWNREGEPTVPSVTSMTMTGVTSVTILASPPAGNIRREVLGLELFNRDTNTVSSIVRTSDARTCSRMVLLTNELMAWQQGYGWYSLDVNGARKEN